MYHLRTDVVPVTTITGQHDASQQDKARAMIFLCHHLNEELKTEYLTISDSLELWTSLHERYENYKHVLLPKARYEWIHLRLQDYKTINQYNSALFKIVSKLRLCEQNITEEDMLEKTFSIFHASNMLLQQQYRERMFKKYCEPIACLLLAKENNELLLKNHQSRPTGSAAFSKVNAAAIKGFRPRRNRGRGHNNRHFTYGEYTVKTHVANHQKWNRVQPINMKAKAKPNVLPRRDNSDNCHRCGRERHWSRTCRTPKHLVNLFQSSVKEKMKELKTNFASFERLSINDEPSTSTYLDAGDFLEYPMEE